MLLSRFARNRRMITTFVMLAAVLLAAFPGASQAAPQAVTRYVAPSGTDSGNCTISAPCRTIQYAVNKAVSGDNIFVAGGTYTYAANDDCSFLTTRAVVCIVNKTLRVVGGFSTANWAVPVPSLNPTIIDGQNSRRGVSLVSFNGVARMAMENFSIENGYAKGASSGGDFFTYAAGGGIDATGSSVELEDVVFRNNRSVGGDMNSGYGGGGIGAGLTIRSSPNGAISTLKDVVFEDNVAQGGTAPERGGVAQGGGFFIDNATVIATNLQFRRNQALAASAPGSGISNGLRADALGGAVALGGNANATFYNIYLDGNHCQGGNAATLAGNCFGGAMYAENNSQLTVNDGVLRNNTSVGGNGTTGGGGFGGGISTFDANATLNRTLIVDNVAQGGVSTNNTAKGGAGGGGAAFIGENAAYQVNLVNVVVARNQMQLVGGGTDPGMGGAGLSFQGIQATMTHSTVAYNRFATNGFALGQAMYVLSTAGGRTSSVTLNYSLIASHTNSSNVSAVHVAQNNAITFNRGLFANNTRNTNSDNVPFPAGSYSGLNTMLTTQYAGFRSPTDYRLTSESAARDAADNSTTNEDVTGFPRPYGATRDIGAYEYNAQVPRVYLPGLIRN